MFVVFYVIKYHTYHARWPWQQCIHSNFADTYASLKTLKLLSNGFREATTAYVEQTLDYNMHQRMALRHYIWFYAFNNWTFVALRFDFDINQNIDIRRVCLVIPLRNLIQRGYSICALRVCVCMNVFSLEARFCRKKKLARIFLYFVHLISMVKGQTPFSSQLVE